MKHLQQCQLIMALVMAINEAKIAEMVCHYGGGHSGIDVYGWQRSQGEAASSENKIYDKTVYIDWDDASERLAILISDLQGMLSNTEAAA